ncbi:hypothetical protein Tco_0766177 [Tanacetum coccineum]
MPRECLRIIESKSKVRNSRKKVVVAKVSSNSSTLRISPDVAALTTEVSELKNMMKIMLNLTQIEKLRTRQLRLGRFVNSNTASSSNSGSLPSNTVTNPKEDLKEQGDLKDTIFPTNNGITEDVQPLVVPVKNQNPIFEPDVAPVNAPMPNPKPSIPYPSKRNDERNSNEQKEKMLMNKKRNSMKSSKI